MPYYLGEEGTEQFEVITEVNGREIGRQNIHDPFISTSVTIGWQDILRSLLFGLKIRVNVRATHAAQRRIMMLDPVEMQREEQERHGPVRYSAT